jgi:opacity protein-like surface antigen
MRKTYLVMAGCLILAIASPALAANGFYMGFEGGATFLNDANFEGTGASTGASFTTEYDTGYVAGGFLGYQDQYMRFEAEMAFRQNDWNDLTDFTVAGFGTVSSSFKADDIGVSGETNVLNTMANVYLDMHNSSPFTPYLMAGVGFAYIEISDVSFSTAGTTIPVADEDDLVLAWQGGAGLSYAFNEVVSMNIDYRYFATSDPEFTDVDFEYDSHNIMASLLFHL